MAATTALWLLLIVLLLLFGRGRDARDIARFLCKRLVHDERVPRRAKLALALLIPYLAMPFDLVPDFIPVAGQLDDAILIAAAIAYVARSAGREVVEDLWPGSERGLRVLLAFA